jgi:nucleotide-binding universal stress UspA family protein
MKTILVPLDFSEATDSIIEVGREFAKMANARIVLTHVLAVVANEVSSFVEEPESATGQLRDLELALRSEGFEVETSQLRGPPAASILAEADRVEADYIVIGSHGHGAIYDVLIGSTASQILKRAFCPVLIVPATRWKQTRGESNRRNAHA